jgi:hypothetical protein
MANGRCNFCNGYYTFGEWRSSYTDFFTIKQECSTCSNHVCTRDSCCISRETDSLLIRVCRSCQDAYGLEREHLQEEYRLKDIKEHLNPNQKNITCSVCKTPYPLHHVGNHFTCCRQCFKFVCSCCTVSTGYYINDICISCHKKNESEKAKIETLHRRQSISCKECGNRVRAQSKMSKEQRELALRRTPSEISRFCRCCGKEICLDCTHLVDIHSTKLRICNTCFQTGKQHNPLNFEKTVTNVTEDIADTLKGWFKDILK